MPLRSNYIVYSVLWNTTLDGVFFIIIEVKQLDAKCSCARNIFCSQHRIVLHYTVKSTQWMSDGVSFHQPKSSVAASFLNEDILSEQLKNILEFQFSVSDFLYSCYVPNSVWLKLWKHKTKYMYKTYESFSCQKLIISTLIHRVLTGFERSSCTEQLGSWRSTLCSDIKLQFLSLQGYKISDFKQWRLLTCRRAVTAVFSFKKGNYFWG